MQIIEKINKSIEELRKVFFPTLKEIKKYLINVIIVVIVITAYLSVVDAVLQEIVKQIIFQG